MNESEFWDLIDRSREAANGDSNVQADELTTLLRGRSADDLETFGGFFETALARMYRWDCWEAGILINNGMGDDTFTDFRAWIVSRGRDVYEQMLRDPDGLAELPEVRDGDVFEAERFAYVAHRVYVEAFDEEPDFPGEPEASVPVGPALDADDVERVLPRLWALRGAM